MRFCVKKTKERSSRSKGKFGNSLSKPWRIEADGHTTEFSYNHDRQRYKRLDIGTGGTTTTQYTGSVEWISGPDGDQIKRYIGEHLMITMLEGRNSDASQTRLDYLLRDHLGSVTVVLDKQGAVTHNLSFDPWGQRRSADWQTVLNVVNDWTSITSYIAVTTRGFTGHEMLDQVGLIHMNGRVYDPRLARFLQADIQVQFPSDAQSYNRYSYVHNNPLRYTDSSGYGLDFFDAVKIIGSIVLSVVPGGQAFIPAWNAFWSAAQVHSYGGDTGQIAHAAYSSFVLSSVTINFGVGGYTPGELITIGTLGGIASTLSGGKFGHGFVSAGVGAYIGGSTLGGVGGTAGEIVGRTLVKAVIGGTLSELTGGKFANGAVTAAFAAVVSTAARSVTLAGGSGELPPEAYENLEERIAKANLEIDQAYNEGRLSSSNRFETVDAAVQEVTGVAGPISDTVKLELGGDIQRLSGGFGYSRPVVGSPSKVTISLSANSVAVWHTHPNAPWITPLFSVRDLLELKPGISSYKYYNGKLNVCTSATCNYGLYREAEMSGLPDKMRHYRTGRVVE